MYQQHTLDRAQALARVVALAMRPLGKSEIVAMLGEVAQGWDEQATYRYIEAAIASDWLVRQGDRRAARYLPTPSWRRQCVEREIAQPHLTRAKVGYRPAFLDAYEPDRTFYLKPEQLAALHAACPPGSAPLSQIDQRVIARFMLDLAFASSRLEGNTYDYGAAANLIEHQQRMNGADPTDAVMLINHYQAVSFLVNNIHFPARPNDVAVRAHDLFSLHTLLSIHLLDDQRRCGSLRRSAVEIGESAYIPLSFADQIEARFRATIEKACQISDPFEQAFFLCVQLPYLQPFDDVNKRTARVACSIPLLRKGCLPMSWFDTTAREYIPALLAVYEYLEVRPMADLFTQAYCRSAERFKLRRPDTFLPRFREAISRVVAARVRGEDDRVPPGLAVSEAESFELAVQQSLDALFDNPMLAIAHGLRDVEVMDWVARMQPAQPGGGLVERLRA